MSSINSAANTEIIGSVKINTSNIGNIAPVLSEISVPEVTEDEATTVVDTVNTSNISVPPQSTTHTTHTHIESNNWNKPFWRTTFSGRDGVGSTSRISAFSLILVVEIWVSYLIYKKQNIPSDIMTLGWFTALLVCVIYYPSKFVDVIKTYFTKKP